MQIELKRKIAAFVAFTAVLFAGAVPVAAQDQERPFPEPDQQLQPLKNQFNADIGKIRVLLIGDPTCPPCRHGASVIQENVVSKFASDKLAVYVVWVPLLNLQDPATLQRHAHQYARLIPSGPRVTHYSDSGAYVGKKYGPIIAVPYGFPPGMSTSHSTLTHAGATLPRCRTIGSISWAACHRTNIWTVRALQSRCASS